MAFTNGVFGGDTAPLLPETLEAQFKAYETRFGAAALLLDNYELTNTVESDWVVIDRSGIDMDVVAEGAHAPMSVGSTSRITVSKVNLAGGFGMTRQEIAFAKTDPTKWLKQGLLDGYIRGLSRLALGRKLGTTDDTNMAHSFRAAVVGTTDQVDEVVLTTSQDKYRKAIAQAQNILTDRGVVADTVILHTPAAHEVNTAMVDFGAGAASNQLLYGSLTAMTNGLRPLIDNNLDKTGSSAVIGYVGKAGSVGAKMWDQFEIVESPVAKDNTGAIQVGPQSFQQFYFGHTFVGVGVVQANQWVPIKLPV